MAQCNFKSRLSLKKERAFGTSILFLLWFNYQSSKSSLCSGFFLQHLWPKGLVYVLLIDTGGGGAHHHTPVGKQTSLPQAGSGPSGNEHRDSDSPHCAVGAAGAHRDPLPPTWGVFEVLDLHAGSFLVRAREQRP